jgi:hypothetical protein
MIMNQEDQNHIYQHLVGVAMNLQPCPFCGESADIENSAMANYKVYCKCCNAELPGNAFDNIYDPKKHIECINSAVENWNKRAQS